MKARESEHRREIEKNKRLKKAFRPITLSFTANLLLFILKLWAGMVSGSVALVADAWHTVSDSLSTIVVFAGFKVTAKKADKEHPYGHEMGEKIAGVIVAVLLFFIGGNFLIDSVRRLALSEAARFGPAAVWVLAVSVAVKEVLARYSISTARKIDSDSLAGDGWHHRSDALSSLLILGGVTVGRRWWWVDGALGSMVALMLFRTAYALLKKNSSYIMGESLSSQKIKEIKYLVQKEVPGCGEAHHFHIHSYGSHCEISFHISLSGDISLREAHRKATLIEEAVREKTGFEPTVHVEHHSGCGAEKKD